MTPEQIQQLTIECGAVVLRDKISNRIWECTDGDLARFAALVRDAALDDAADVCDDCSGDEGLITAAAAIRAMKGQP